MISGEKDEKKDGEDFEAVSYNSEEGKSKWAKIFLTAAIVASYICLVCSSNKKVLFTKNNFHNYTLIMQILG